jgi:hypothetical protein
VARPRCSRVPDLPSRFFAPLRTSFPIFLEEIFRLVRVMNGRNLLRLAGDEQLLGSWINASTVYRKPEGGAPADGEERPAA